MFAGLRTLARYRTPPGKLNPFDIKLFTEQRYLLSLAEKLGPVFKAARKAKWTTYVVGHKHIRRLLADNESGLPCATLDLTPLFPTGSVRGMDGSLHATYRRKLIHAVQAVDLKEHNKQITENIVNCLDDISRIATPDGTVADITPYLRNAASAIMFEILFGISRTSARFAPLRDAYRRFGPGQPASDIGPSQLASYQQIRGLLAAQIDDPKRDGEKPELPNLLRNAVDMNELDETLVGNIIYMHEPAHFDIFSLWRWIIHYLADSPHVLEQYRNADPSEKPEFAGAIVRETLRLDQSEVLLRKATKDIEFQGYHIPADTSVRLCLWEGHKDAANFPDPFRFDPTRFLNNPPGADQYSPFGMDRHRCIGADVVMSASTVFVEQLICRFDIAITDEKPAFRGAFHWEPHPQMKLAFTPVVSAESG